MLSSDLLGIGCSGYGKEFSAGAMSSGFEQMLLDDNLTTYAGAPVLQGLYPTQGALTWYLALPSS